MKSSRSTSEFSSRTREESARRVSQEWRFRNATRSRRIADVVRTRFSGLLFTVLAVFVAATARAETNRYVRCIGWRTDSTGSYPDATPPLKWSQSSKNAAWVTPMPGMSGATPVIFGDRIFILADPFWLLCVRKSDGQIMWKKSNSIDEVIPAGGMEEYRRRCSAWLDVSEKTLELEIEKLKLGRKQMDLPADDPDSIKRIQAIDAETKSLQDKVSKLPRFAEGSKPGGWQIGYSCCTPLCNGSVVVALFGNGVCAVYDLDGNLQWAKFLRHRLKGYGQSMSPAMAGDVVGVHIDDDFFGLDLKTGKTLWVEYELQHEGSPVGMRAGDMDVFIINDGNVRAATNGAVVAKLGLMRFNTPSVQKDGSVWYMDNDRSLAGVRLEPDDKGGLRVKRIGGGPAAGKIYWSSALIHDGMAYLWDGDGNVLSVVDLKTGQQIYQQNFSLGAAYVSPTGAGPFVFVAGAGGGCVVLRKGWKTVEMGPDRSKQVFELNTVAQNSLDAFWACPVFEGDRMYMRTFKNLYCFVASDEEKRMAAPQEEPKPAKKKNVADELEDIVAP